MKKYMDFGSFRKDVVEALADVEKKYGVKLDTGNITYDSNSLTLQLKAARTDKDVQKEEFLQAVRYMPMFTADDYMKKVVINKRTFTITGLKPGNKYNVVLTRDDGKVYNYVVTAVIDALKKEA